MNEFAEKHIKKAGEDFLGFPRFASAHCIFLLTVSGLCFNTKEEGQD